MIVMNNSYNQVIPKIVFSYNVELYGGDPLLQVISQPHLNPPNSRLTQVPVWTEEDVTSWVARSGFQDFAPAFQELRVDGDMLLQLTETEIRDDIGISNGILRKRFMRELKELKKTADYTSCDGGLMANFLNRISSEFKVYTYNLILKELSLDFMQRLTTTDMDDMLMDSGVESAIHRHKIIEAVLNMDEESSFSDSVYSEPSIDVYLSYSQSRAELASLIKIQLEQRDPELSIIDASHDDTETFSEDVSFLIRDSKYFVLVLSPGGLDSCLSPRSWQCRLYQEIQTALKAGLKIIPVTDEFQWPMPESLPEEIRKVTSFNGVRWVHDYQVSQVSQSVSPDPECCRRPVWGSWRGL